MHAHFHHRTTSRHAAGPRRGVALVLFVMLVFAFMAVAALCIDMGMASLTQAQMQNAVDSAAIEGVASRDFFEERGPGNIFRRRYLVPDRVRHVFDDDFAPTGTDTGSGAAHFDQGRFAAGPVFRLENGIGNVNALALLEVPTPSEYQSLETYVDDPVLRANMSDARYGDMLSGTYRRGQPSIETPGTYARLDFVPASASVSPAPAIESWRALSFLVRMRRTGAPDFVGVNQNNASFGPTVPFLFALGSTIHAGDDDYNPRRDGLTVRATAIGVAGPVTSAGPLPFKDDCSLVLERNWPNVPFWRASYGIGPIALEKSYWSDVLPEFTDDVDDLVRIKVDGATGRLEIESASGPSVLAGRLYFGNAIDCVSGDLTSVGQGLEVPFSPTWVPRLSQWLATVASTPTALGSFANKGRCYIPIYSRINGVDRVVGYGHGTIQRHEDSTGTQVYLELGKGFPDQDEGIPGVPCAAFVAPENASVHLTGLPAELTEAERERVFEELIDLTYTTGAISYDWRDVRNGALLAPALAR